MAEAARKSLLGSAWMVLAAGLLAAMGVLVKASATRFAMNPYELVFWRSVLGVFWLGGQGVLTGGGFATRYAGLHVQRAVAGTGGMVLFFFGLTQLPLASAVTLNYTSAIFLALLSVWLLKERLPWRTWAALAAGLAGIVLLLRPSFGAGHFQAALLCLGSGLCAGYAYLTVRRLTRVGEPAWRVVFYFSLAASLLSGAAACVQGWHVPTWQSTPYLAAIGLLSMGGQLALTQAYRYGRPFAVAALSYLTVVFSALAGVWLWGEGLSAAEVAGMVLIVAAGLSGSLR